MAGGITMEKKIKQAERLVSVLRKLNPYVKFEVKPNYSLGTASICGNIPGMNVILPKNVFFNDKWGFNNGLSRGSLDYHNIEYIYVQ
jgi:formylmethanofuran dehydrogenase subunit B